MKLRANLAITFRSKSRIGITQPELERISYVGPAGDINHDTDDFYRQKTSWLVAVDAETGKTQSCLPLPAQPVFDGLAAAGDRLYSSMADGTVRCFE